MCLLFRPTNTIFRNFSVKLVFQRKISIFLISNYPILMFLLCTTIETVTSMISCQTFFYNFFYFSSSVMFFVLTYWYDLQDFFVKTVFQRIRNFLTSNFRFAVSFLCTTIETIFRRVFCQIDYS